MKEPKKFLTIEEQISFLKNKGILFKNESKAKTILSKKSYYNIINGYSDPFLFLKNPKKYKKDVYFEEIYSLYFYDTRIRTLILPYIIEVENNIKTEIIYAFCNARRKDELLKEMTEEYLLKEYYDSNENKSEQVKNLISDINLMRESRKKSSESFEYYLKNYGYIPLWVLATQMTFGMISKFYECMPISCRMSVAKIYNLPENHLRTILKILTLIRNACAHGNRIYCFSHKFSLPSKFENDSFNSIQSFINDGYGKTDLFSVIICLKILLDKKNFKSLINSIKNETKYINSNLHSVKIDEIYKYMGFPKNWEHILD